MTNKTYFSYFILGLLVQTTAFPTNAMDTPCSRLTTEEHRKLSAEAEVDLIKKNLSDGDLKILQPILQKNTSLTKLDLFKSNIGPKGVKILSSLPCLRILNLEENKVGDEGAAVFETNATLEVLNLWKNGITDLGVIPLARNTTLRELGLYKNDIGDLGAFALSANGSLRKLDIRRNRICDKGTQALACQSTLEIVLLGDNSDITDDGAKAFLNKDNFVHVDLSRTKVSDEAIKLFEQAFPHNGFLIHRRPRNTERLKTLSSSSTKDLLPLKDDTVFLLSIDGGGIRGIIPALVLQHLEEKLARKLERPVNLVNAFDWMAGTSTGGLITLGLNIPNEQDPTKPKFPVSQLVELYQKFGSVIFPKTWSLGLFKAIYDVKPLEKLLDDYFGNVYLSEIMGNVLITAFNMGEDTDHLFNSHKAKKNAQKDFRVRDAARSTSAAPTYFPAAQVTNRQNRKYSFIDGGVYANNPTVIGIEHVQKLYPHAKKIVVLSLGTGEELADRKMIELNNAGILGWAPKIAGHLMKNAAKVAKENIQALIQQDKRLEYIRIQATVAGTETEMDNISEDNIQALMNVGQATIRAHKNEIEQIVNALLKKL